MKFICVNCRRDFDIGAPKGMQLPCPACGGMLVDEEAAAARPQAGAAPAAASPAAPVLAGGVVPHAPAPAAADEISLDAAEAFARRSAESPPPAEPAAEEPAGTEWPLTAQELLGGAEATGAPPAEEAPPQEQEQGQDAEWPQEAAAPAEEPAAACAPPSAGVGEAAANPLVLIAGWVLFGMSVVGLGLMAYFLKDAHDQLKKGVIPREVQELHLRVQRERKEAIERAEALEKKKDELQEKSDKLDEQVRSATKRLQELDEAAKKSSEAVARLEAELTSTTKTLRERELELREARKKLEEEAANAARLARRVAASVHAFRAAELIDRPSHWAEALRLLEAAIKGDEELDEAYLVRGIVLARLRRCEDALADFEKADESARRAGALGHARALVLAGDSARTILGDKERASRYYKRAMAAAPGSPWGLLAEVSLARLQGQTESARQKAAEAIRSVEASGADATPLRLALAEILSSYASSRRAAIEELDKVIAACPACAEALDLRGRLLVEEGASEAAAHDLARAAELDPLDARRFVSLGKILLALKRASAAEQALRRALSLATLPPEAALDVRVELGRALVLLGRHEEAVRELGAVLAAREGDVSALRVRGEARAALGDYRAALQDLEEALRLGVDDAKVRMLLSSIYATARDARYRNPQKAVDNARAAVELTESRSAEALSCLSVAYASAGDYTRATIEMRKALQLDPGNEVYRTALRTYEAKSQ